MGAAESAIVFLPRFTTLVGPATFTTSPLDVSQFASAQFQVWRSALLNPNESGATFKIYLEESLDAENWVLGASAPKAQSIGALEIKLFSYGFRLRWFRLRVELSTNIVTCWSEGILR